MSKNYTNVTNADLPAKTGPVKLVLSSMKLLYDVNFFGVGGSQLSVGMQGLSLEWTGDYVRVTSSNYPGQEKWILPGGIKELTWRSE